MNPMPHQTLMNVGFRPSTQPTGETRSILCFIGGIPATKFDNHAPHCLGSTMSPKDRALLPLRVL